MRSVLPSHTAAVLVALLAATFATTSCAPRTPAVPEPGFVALFNGRDLTGWGDRPTSEADKENARNWQASDPQGAAEWPFLTKPESFDGLERSPDGRFAAINGRLVVTNGGSADVRYYAADGAHLRTTGRRGQGPGEFQRPGLLLPLAGVSVLVVDGRVYLCRENGILIGGSRVGSGLDHPGRRHGTCLVPCIGGGRCKNCPRAHRPSSPEPRCPGRGPAVAAHIDKTRGPTRSWHGCR